MSYKAGSVRKLLVFDWGYGLMVTEVSKFYERVKRCVKLSQKNTDSFLELIQLNML